MGKKAKAEPRPEGMSPSEVNSLAREFMIAEGAAEIPQDSEGTQIFSLPVTAREAELTRMLVLHHIDPDASVETILTEILKRIP